jgi:hypothetical protein
LDQGHFLLPPPRFDLLFAPDGVADILEGFKIDEPMNAVLRGKTLYRLLFVFKDPAKQIIGQTGVQIARPASQDVNKVALL